MGPAGTDRWLAIAERFAVPGRIVGVRPYGSGLINTTLLIETDTNVKAILQGINRQVFAEPEKVQANLRTLLDHVASANCGDSSALRLPAIVPTRAGADFYVDAGGNFWRALSFIDATQTFETLEDEAQAREIGQALGRFHALLSGLKADRLHDTLPGFHVTPGYLSHFDRVRAAFPGSTSDETLRACLQFVAERRSMVGVLEEARQAGRLRDRVIHGDPKLSNILFDAGSGRAVALIDLDTVKPGLIHYDLGDCLRSICNRAGEGGSETVEFDVDLCRQVLSGYFAAAQGLLTEADIAHLFDAIRLLPFELGLRFLTDHLAGDRYFRVTQPGQNMHRAAVQFRLVESIERQESAIRGLCSGG